MRKLSESFRDAVERECAKNGISQKELARRVGVKPPVISRLLGTDADPRLETVQSVAAALGIEPWKLLQDAGATLGEIARQTESISETKQALYGLVNGLDEEEAGLALSAMSAYLQGFRGEPLNPIVVPKKVQGG